MENTPFMVMVMPPIADMSMHNPVPLVQHENLPGQPEWFGSTGKVAHPMTAQNRLYSM